MLLRFVTTGHRREARIDEPIFTYHNGYVWEFYKFKKLTIANELAELDDSNKHFSWSVPQKYLLERRGNFHGATLLTMITKGTNSTSSESTLVSGSFEVNMLGNQSL